MSSLSKINPGNKISKEGQILRQEGRDEFNLACILSTLLNNKKGIVIDRNAKGT